MDKTWEHILSHNTGGKKRLYFDLVHAHKDSADSITMHVAMQLNNSCMISKIVRCKVDAFLSLYDEYKIKDVSLFDENDEDSIYTYAVELRRI